MAARRYEIYLRELKNISRVSAANEWNIFQHEKRNFVSPSGHVMFYLLYKHQWNAKPFHFNIFFGCERRDVSCSQSNRDLFTCEDNMLFSHVKISCFRAKAYLVFHWYLYNKYRNPLQSTSSVLLDFQSFTRNRFVSKLSHKPKPLFYHIWSKTESLASSMEHEKKRWETCPGGGGGHSTISFYVVSVFALITTICIC